MNASASFKKLGLAVLLAFSMTRLHASDKGPKPDKELQKYAGEYDGETRTKTESLSESETQEYALKHHTIELSLGGDGSATVTQSSNGTDEVTTFGHFKVSGGQLTITFDPPPDGKATPAPMTFSTGHNELTAVSYDHSIWSKLPPPPLHKTVEARPSKAGKRGSS